MMALKLILKLLLTITVYLSGFIALPIILHYTPAGAKKLRWLDSIYGNKIDGPDGDAAYQAKVKHFRRFRWLQLRNPINNLLRRLGPNGVIRSIKADVDFNNPDYWKGEYRIEITMTDGRRYIAGAYTIVGRLHFVWGFAPYRDDRIGSVLKPMHHFENRLFTWPFKVL